MLLTVGLVVMVIFVFLRKLWATVIPSVALPLAIVGTFGVMKLLGFSLDNLSLMALTISTGFVVDDAIVMIENIVRFIEMGEKPMDAALKGAKQIGFTVISLSVSLIAVFIPLLFMTGIVGRLFREFAITLSLAVLRAAHRCVLLGTGESKSAALRAMLGEPSRHVPASLLRRERLTVIVDDAAMPERAPAQSS